MELIFIYTFTVSLCFVLRMILLNILNKESHQVFKKEFLDEDVNSLLSNTSNYFLPFINLFFILFIITSIFMALKDKPIKKSIKKEKNKYKKIFKKKPRIYIYSFIGENSFRI